MLVNFGVIIWKLRFMRVFSRDNFVENDLEGKICLVCEFYSML